MKRITRLLAMACGFPGILALSSCGGAPVLFWRISRRFFRNLPLLAGLLALFALLASKEADAVQPPNSALNGTWVNTQSSGLIAQVVIGSGVTSLGVHLYGFCSPSPCDWGGFGAPRFSEGVTSKTAVGFHLTVSSPTDNKTVQGHLTGSGTLEVTTQISYPQGGPDNNYEVTDEFQLQGSTGGPAPSVPSNPPSLAGTWTAVKSDGGLTHVIITESGGALQIHPYGSCSPTDCDWGVQPASQFSDDPTSSSPVGFQSSINQMFASRFLQGHLILGSTGETLLEITTQSTFAKSDPRYDYELTEDFQPSTTGMPSFSMNSASSSLTVTSGGEASDIITITPVNGSWDSAVQLTCSVTGTSPTPTCSWSEPSVTPGSSAVSSTLTVKMPTVATRDPKKLPGSILYAALAPFALGVALVGGSARRRKRCRIPWTTIVLATLCLVLFACGGSTTNTTGIQQQAAGPYTIKVIASSGNIQLATQITVTTQ
jgi:hypothetical protein